MEYQQPDKSDLLKSQGLAYTQKSKKLEDARSSSWLFLIFGFLGLALILCVWLGIVPLHLAFYMKLLYTIVLGALFFVFIITGCFYLKKSRTLKEETLKEERVTEEIISYITANYSLEDLDKMINDPGLSMEQRYFERYEQISGLIQEKYQIQEESYLDYLIDNIYQIYVPEK